MIIVKGSISNGERVRSKVRGIGSSGELDFRDAIYMGNVLYTRKREEERERYSVPGTHIYIERDNEIKRERELS